MKFDGFDFAVYTNEAYIIPTIQISKQCELQKKNFNIQVHFAVFHFRWRWVDGN